MICVGFVSADEGGYTISAYTVDINLNTNWSMHVVENITANFSEERHGIYREIPIYANERNFLIENLTTSNDPIAANTIENGNYSLKLGSADKTILGEHTYIISYDVQNPITTIQTTWGSHQELYRNIIGNERNTSIKNINFSIKLPQAHTFLSGDMFALYGPNGAKYTTDVVIKQTSNTTIVWSLNNKLLNPNEGLTIGLNFWSEYFTLPTNYETLGENIQTSTPILNKIFFIIPFLIFVGFFSLIRKVFKIALRGMGKWYRSSKKAVTIYYTPPKNVEIPEAFWFRYMTKNPKIFSALIYYRATRWWLKIENQHGKYLFGLITTNTYKFIETGTKPIWTTAFEDILFQSFFGVYDKTLDAIEIDSTSYKKVSAIFTIIQDTFNKNNLTQSGWLFWLSKTLTPEWEILFEQMRGYKEFLEKVERPVIESELKNDPEYINKLLPWAVLFGLETKLLTRIEDLLQTSSKNRYDSNNGRWLNVASFMAMSSAIQTNSVAPSRWGSGFWGSGSSWWGGGWGGWGSR